MTSHLMNTPQHLTREAFDAVVQDDADAVVTLAPVVGRRYVRTVTNERYWTEADVAEVAS